MSARGKGQAGPVADGAQAERRLRRVVTRIYDLPSFPTVIRKLMTVAEDPGSSSKDLAKVMSQDQGLSAKILKLVNSAFYGLQKPVSSLQHAVSLLGYNSVRSMALSVSIFAAFRGMEDLGSFSRARFWEHSLAAGLGARWLARVRRAAHPDEAFTAGLLHDIGILLEARYLSEAFDEAVDMAVENRILLRAAEAEVFGLDHPVIGGWLAEKWRLPEPVRDAIVYHHDWELDRPVSEEARAITSVVALVNRILRSTGRTYEPATPPPEEPILEEEELAGIEPSDVLGEVEARLESCRVFLQM